MNDVQNDCPKCRSTYSYQDGDLWICPECAHEWTVHDSQKEAEVEAEEAIKDANGTVLQDGDTVTVIKTLKVKGATSDIKVGTKVKNIKLNFHSSDGHNISCKIDGFGSMGLKSEFVKKA